MLRSFTVGLPKSQGHIINLLTIVVFLEHDHSHNDIPGAVDTAENTENGIALVSIGLTQKVLFYMLIFLGLRSA